MIAELNESNRPQFLAAVRGRPYFGDILPVHLAVFGRSGALMRFYVADGSAAVQLKGRSAVLCGTYDAEETGAFLRMQGVRYVNAGGAAPAGYSPLYALHNLVLAKAAAPPCPDAVRLTLDRAPAPAEVTDFMMRGEDDPGAWDNFYSELCTKLARGAAEVWAVRREGALVSTGIGGWLTGLLAADLAARGRRVALSCKKERLNFYHRLGFAAEDTVQRYALDGLPEEK